jgi:hypothetical protein
MEGVLEALAKAVSVTGKLVSGAIVASSRRRVRIN